MKNLAKLVLVAATLVALAHVARADWGSPYPSQGVQPPRFSFWSKTFFAQKARRDQARWNQLWKDYEKQMEAYQRQMGPMQMQPAPHHAGYPIHTGMPAAYHPQAMPQAQVVMPAVVQMPAAQKGVATVTDRK